MDIDLSKLKRYNAHDIIRIHGRKFELVTKRDKIMFEIIYGDEYIPLDILLTRHSNFLLGAFKIISKNKVSEFINLKLEAGFCVFLKDDLDKTFIEHGSGVLKITKYYGE